MLKNPGVTYVPEHLLPMSPVYTPSQWEREKYKKRPAGVRADRGCNAPPYGCAARLSTSGTPMQGGEEMSVRT